MHALDAAVEEGFSDKIMNWSNTLCTTSLTSTPLPVYLSTTDLLLMNETSPSFDYLITESITATVSAGLWPVSNGSSTTSRNNSKPWPTLKQPIYAVVLLSAAYLLVAIVGVVSNGMVVMVIIRNVRMRTVTNYFLSNLAMADILVCIFVLPITLLENIFTGKTLVLC